MQEQKQQYNAEEVIQKLLQILPSEEDQEARVRDIYFPLLNWVLEQRTKTQPRACPLIFGLNGPQGSGKSTLTSTWVQVFSQLGIRAVTLSIDDFYLTRDAQVALANAHPHNSLLQQRGYPGTHDVRLGLEILENLSTLMSGSIRVPIYDKSKYQGQGDRLPEAEWNEIRGPLDLVFLEGWMLGFMPVTDSLIFQKMGAQADSLQVQAFQEVNRLLIPYEAWYQRFDAFIQLVPKEIEYVVDWRVEAEARMISKGKAGMNREEISAYIQKFILAYQIYLPQLTERVLLSSKSCSIVLSKERLKGL
jgi:D-glycerate 3-kinase